MRLVVPKPLVTFAPSANTITLASPFHQILEVDVLRIRDDTTGEMLYDRSFPRNTISVVAGVITYSYDNAHQAANDDLQVELEFGYYAPQINVFTTQAVAASATLNPSSKVYVEGADSIWIDTSNAGASTNLTVNVYPYLNGDSEAVAGAVILPLTISNTVKATSIIETGMPYIAVGAVNNDASNAASLNAVLKITWK
jgi:hypothetical protein